LMRLGNWVIILKWLTKNQNLIQENILTRYLETVQSNQKTIVFSSFVSNLEFIKNGASKTIDFCELTGATHKMNARIKCKFQEQERLNCFSFP
jgi:hypothetical protein